MSHIYIYICIYIYVYIYIYIYKYIHLFKKIDFKIILLNYHLNVLKTNQCILAIMQTYITNWQTVLKTQENNAKMLLVILKDLKRINQSKIRFWIKTRSEHWWKVIVFNHFLNEDWLENFRMKRTNFQFICDELRLELRPAIPFLVSREPLSVEEKWL